MTLVKLDQPRHIDQIIDYFGERRPGEARDVRPNVATHRAERAAAAAPGASHWWTSAGRENP